LEMVVAERPKWLLSVLLMVPVSGKVYESPVVCLTARRVRVPDSSLNRPEWESDLRAADPLPLG
jgi:hypothetical protein